MGSICMLMTTEYHSNHRDIIPRNLADLDLYKTDRNELHKKGYRLSASIYNSKDNQDERESTNDVYYNLFESLSIKMVTTQQGTKEWHLCRLFSFTSSTMGELMIVLDYHKVDWPEFKIIKQFYSKQAYNEQQQQQNTTNQQQVNQQPVASSMNTQATILDLASSATSSPLSPIIQRESFSVVDLFANTSTLSTPIPTTSTSTATSSTLTATSNTTPSTSTAISNTAPSNFTATSNATPSNSTATYNATPSNSTATSNATPMSPATINQITLARTDFDLATTNDVAEVLV